MLDVTNVKKIHWQKYIGPVGILANLNVDHLICWPWIRKKLFSILQIVQQANDDFTGFFLKSDIPVRKNQSLKSMGKGLKAYNAMADFLWLENFDGNGWKKSASQLSSPRLSLRMLGGLLPQQHSAANYWGCISVQCEGMRGGLDNVDNG